MSSHLVAQTQRNNHMKTIHEHLGFGSSFSNRSNARLKQYKLFNNSITGNIHVNIKIVTSAETGFYYSIE